MSVGVTPHGESMARDGMGPPWVNGPEKGVSRRSKVPTGEFRSPSFEIPPLKITHRSDSGRNRPRSKRESFDSRFDSAPLTPP